MSTYRLRVLAYHRVVAEGTVPSPNPSLVSATPTDFEWQMRHLAAHYRVVSLSEVLEAQRGGRPLPRGAVLLTFDDAYVDLRDHAWPVLRRLGLPVTVFVPTAYPDHPERVFWWDRVHHALSTTERRTLVDSELGVLPLDSDPAREESRRAIEHHVKRVPHEAAMELVERICVGLGSGPTPRSEVLGWDELRALEREGVSLAAHTRTHPALTQLSDDALETEIAGSIEDLERETGSAIPAFCYPFGLYDDRAVAAARRQGVEVAFTCREGHSHLPAADPLRLDRTVVTRRTSPVIFGLRLLPPVSRVDRWRKRRSASGAARPAFPAGTDEARRADPPMTASSGAARRIPSDERGVGGGRRETKVAYIMSRFPKLSETFVLNEILAMEASGVGVEVYPLLRERQPVAHPEVDRWVERANFHPFLSLPILRAHAHFLRRDPRTYLRTLREVLGKTLGSTNFFVGALGIFPKSVRFAYEMESGGVTHVHAHFCTHPALAALIVHRLTGIPFSFTAHGSDLHVDRRMLDTKVEAAAFAVTISEFNREVMVAECGEQARERIHVVHCGIDPSYFSPSEASGRRTPFQIVCVASLEEVKGHRYLIDACRVLRDRGWDFECHLVGDGPRRRRVEAQVSRTGLASRIHVHGGKPRPEVARLLSSAHVAVLASHPTRDGRKEGIPVALMEAMAAGLPVVATAISGIPELVANEETGILVPSGDPDALAHALERLLEDGELRARMGRAGRARVLADFELSASTRALLRLFAPEVDAVRRKAASETGAAAAGESVPPSATRATEPAAAGEAGRGPRGEPAPGSAPHPEAAKPISSVAG